MSEFGTIYQFTQHYVNIQGQVHLSNNCTVIRAGKWESTAKYFTQDSNSYVISGGGVLSSHLLLRNIHYFPFARAGWVFFRI